MVLVAGDMEMDMAIADPVFAEDLTIYPVRQRLVKVLFCDVHESGDQASHPMVSSVRSTYR